MKNKNIFTYEDKENLTRKIGKIKKKKYLETIRDIIIKYNPNINITENSNGLFIAFHNLENVTYTKINSFLNKINKIELEPSINYYNTNKKLYGSSGSIREGNCAFLSNGDSNLSNISDIISCSNDDTHDIYLDNPKMKFSNKEKNIIKRKIYDKEISGDNRLENLNFNNNIFIRKN
jgi:hypothetical protein